MISSCRLQETIGRWTEQDHFFKTLYIISLYRRDRISSGKAASLLGVHRLTFIRMLAEEGIPYLDYTSDELTEEITAVRPLFLRTRCRLDSC